MVNLLIDAKVECTDGPCGKSTHVIVSPVGYKVTHFAVQDKSLPDNSTRLVPAGNVASVAEQEIRLICTKADVARMPPFLVSKFIQESGPGMAYASGQAYTSQYVVDDTAYDEVQERNIPEGLWAVYSGMHVEASDGHVGRVDGLVVDPNRGEVTYLLMWEGHLWGKREVTIPVSAAYFCDADTVYLKLDTAAVEALPVGPVKGYPSGQRIV